jgi:heme exporter protein A
VSATIIEARGLCRRFGRRWAFARVDLAVQAGDRVLVVGANGSGKTTLLRTLATSLKPSEGALNLFGQDAVHSPQPARKRLALLSDKAGLYEDLSAGDNLRVVARLVGRTADVTSLLAGVGLEDRPEPLRTHSTGMRKRVLLAALQLQRPELMLLDEPFAALDPSGMDAVAELVARLDGTVIIASHQIERAAVLCTKAILLDAGLVRWSGPAHQIQAAWQAVHIPLTGPESA